MWQFPLDWNQCHWVPEDDEARCGPQSYVISHCIKFRLHCTIWGLGSKLLDLV